MLAVLLLSGCARQEEAARQMLAKSFTCPVERVTATRIDGVRWSEVKRRENPIPDPPADVRADPSRLAMWKEQHHAHYSRGFDRYYKAFHVVGCGHEADYLCQCPFDAPAWKQLACTCEQPSVPLVLTVPRLEKAD